jgi:hypothetical protein
MFNAVWTMVNKTTCPRTINSADLAAGSIIQGYLMALAVRTGTKKNTTIERPIDFCLQRKLKIPEIT